MKTIKQITMLITMLILMSGCTGQVIKPALPLTNLQSQGIEKLEVIKQDTEKEKLSKLYSWTSELYSNRVKFSYMIKGKEYTITKQGYNTPRDLTDDSIVLSSKSEVIKKFDNLNMYIGDDTFNDMLYMSIIHDNSTVYTLYSFDGEQLNKKDIKLEYFDLAHYSGNFNHSKYLIKNGYFPHDYDIFNITNTKISQIKNVVILEFMGDKALVFRSLGNSLFNNLQFQLSTIDLLTGKEDILVIENTNSDVKYTISKTQKQLILTNLKTQKSINVLNLKEIDGDVAAAPKLKGKMNGVIINKFSLYELHHETKNDVLNRTFRNEPIFYEDY